MTFTVAILTVSDRCSTGEREDRSGPALVAGIADHFPEATVIATALVPDEPDMIADRLTAWALGPAGSSETPAPDLILTTGGTGLSPRDHTPEATLRVLERRHAGLLELARLRCYEGFGGRKPLPETYLSRGEAGTIRQTLVINFPGSTGGVKDYLAALADILPHAVRTVRGEEEH